GVSAALLAEHHPEQQVHAHRHRDGEQHEHHVREGHPRGVQRIAHGAGRGRRGGGGARPRGAEGGGGGGGRGRAGGGAHRFVSSSVWSVMRRKASSRPGAETRTSWTSAARSEVNSAASARSESAQ